MWGAWGVRTSSPAETVQTELQDLLGPQTLRERRAGVQPRSLPPGALIPGYMILYLELYEKGWIVKNTFHK